MPPKVAKIFVDDDERKLRGQTQKIFLVQTHPIKDANQRSYDVMGTTKNVYTVCINIDPSCTCPDYKTRYRRCKHIYFVLTRIMKVKKEEEDIKKYTEEQVKSMFENVPEITNNLMVDSNLVNKYKQLLLSPNGEVKQRDFSDENCPICLDDLDNGEELLFCKYTCGSSVHKFCFDIFNSKTQNKKCLYCQKDWEKELNEIYIKL